MSVDDLIKNTVQFDPRPTSLSRFGTLLVTKLMAFDAHYKAKRREEPENWPEEMCEEEWLQTFLEFLEIR